MSVTPDAPEVGAAERWMTPGVRGIGSASLLADLGHEVPTALLPSLVTSTLGAPAAALGVIEGVADALAGAARFAGGALADDPQRRRAAAVGGYTATAVLSAAVGAATSVWQVGVLRAGAWAARGLRVPARNALLADVVPATAYGRAYGFERAMDNLGAVGGPLLALALVAAVGVRSAILLSVIPGLLAVVAILYAIRHTARPREQERQPLRIRVRPVLRGRLGRLMVGSALSSSATSRRRCSSCARPTSSNRAAGRTAPCRRRWRSMPSTTWQPRSRAFRPGGSPTVAAPCSCSPAASPASWSPTSASPSQVPASRCLPPASSRPASPSAASRPPSTRWSPTSPRKAYGARRSACWQASRASATSWPASPRVCCGPPSRPRPGCSSPRR